MIKCVITTYFSYDYSFIKAPPQTFGDEEALREFVGELIANGMVVEEDYGFVQYSPYEIAKIVVTYV